MSEPVTGRPPTRQTPPPTDAPPRGRAIPLDDALLPTPPGGADPTDEAPGPASGAAGADPSTGAMDLEDRSALRRVAGLGASSELTDVTEVEYRQLRLERVVLIGVWTEGSVAAADSSLVELARLAETAGSEVLDGLVQRRSSPDPATFVGSGKVAALRETVQATGADTVIADGELSPGQLRGLEEKLKVKVIDRTALILDIFAQHARSKEGKAQVELAQLRYFLPRLRGWGESLSRQGGGAGGGGAGGGGVGTRGPGETKLETDRRRVHRRIAKLRHEIDQMRTVRDTKRGRRRRRAVPAVAIAGYTNAGKSSLLNAVTDAGVLVEDALFATLDPTTRRWRTADGRETTLTDTVGFVRHLPHQLVEAFRSTLEEVAQADLMVHVVDGSDPAARDQIAAVRDVVAEVGRSEGAGEDVPPELLVVNKVDDADPFTLAELRAALPGAVFVSARTGEGIDLLRRRLAEALPHPEVEVEAVLPYTAGSVVARVHAEGEVLAERHTGEGTRLHARVGPELAEAVRRAATDVVTRAGDGTRGGGAPAGGAREGTRDGTGAHAGTVV